jgi:bacterioferritin-associated ferredoxin
MSDHQNRKNTVPQDEIICLCNEVSRGTIEDAIKNGCDTLNKIYDRTSAGVGPCGGSCRKFLGPMLDHYLKSGQFPQGPIRPKPQRKNRRK